MTDQFDFLYLTDLLEVVLDLLFSGYEVQIGHAHLVDLGTEVTDQGGL